MEKAKRILVGLKTLDNAVELTHLACCTGASGADLLLLHVIELPVPTPLDAGVPDLESLAKKIIEAAESVANSSDMNVSSLIIRAHNAGQVLLDEMKEKKVDLAIIGYHHRETLAEILFGTTARHLALHAPCRVLIDVPPRA